MDTIEFYKIHGIIAEITKEVPRADLDARLRDGPHGRASRLSDEEHALVLESEVLRRIVRSDIFKARTSEITAARRKQVLLFVRASRSEST